MTRDRVAIYADILRAVKAQGGEGAKITPVQLEANLPSDRMRRYLAELAEAGLVTGPPWKLTEKGETFLREFARFRGFLADFGILRDDDTRGTR
ncbi:MAG TPA: winged helix-turn-helix domain-containing protein [Candidatus Thermoplasmatota archaeon]|nr:winged helix-turn-helix domain-containing protein [Candidatus Thermoplasmatota archaeon]